MMVEACPAIDSKVASRGLTELLRCTTVGS